MTERERRATGQDRAPSAAPAARAAVGSNAVLRLQQAAGNQATIAHLQRKADGEATGLPKNLKTGIESLSGISMDDVVVHYNSSEPAALRAHAYAQGTDIHVASGQEKHLAHEAWHVVQQKQGRVPATITSVGQPVSDAVAVQAEAATLNPPPS